MTKREMIKEVRDVMTGNSGHSYIMVWKEGRSWKVETNINKFSSDDFEDDTYFQCRHSCNDMTLKETEGYLKASRLI